MRISLPSGTPAELVVPEGRPATRGLVLWPDIFGLRPLFVDHARRLADDRGWAVCVVEPFGGQEDLDLDQRQAAAAALVDADKVADAVAAADACGVEPVGVLGFCMGGMYAMKSLAASGRFDRSVAFYGMVRVPEHWRGGGQGDAIDAVRQRGGSRFLFIFGGGDPWGPRGAPGRVVAAGANVVGFPGAGHGWAQDPDRDNYRATDAAVAWARAVAFLDGSD